MGDKADLCSIDDYQFRLTAVQPRRNVFYRGNRRLPGNNIAVASNVELVILMVSADYCMCRQNGFVEAGLIAARRAGVDAALCVNKIDQLSEGKRQLLDSRIKVFQVNNSPLFLTSTLTRTGLDKLAIFMKSKTSLVVGQRGCGKTSLLHAIAATPNNDGSRLHPQSTNAPNLLQIDSETYAIDTPGFKDFHLHEITDHEKRMAFPEIETAAENCRFRDCTHVHEPECQVIQGIRDSLISWDRYKAYQTLSGVPNRIDKNEKRAQRMDYRHAPCQERFHCRKCGILVLPEGAGTDHRNHCPRCLHSMHVDHNPGDRAEVCHGIMEPVSVWVRKGGEWAIIHRCRECGALSSNRIAADDNPMMLMSLAVRPLSAPPFPLSELCSLQER